MRHLLVTNDYPPKTGGIQNYLWELWRRLPAESFTILTRPYAQSLKEQKKFDEKEPYDIIRSKQRFLLPTSKQALEIKALAREASADLIIFDPALPVGDLGPKLGLPYGHIFHGAEVYIPSKIPWVQKRLLNTLTRAELIIAASKWAILETEKICLPTKAKLPPWDYIPPGVDVDRFVPMEEEKKVDIRTQYNIDPEAFLVTCVSRLVPRKGIDSLIKATALLKRKGKKLQLLIAGKGRDEKRLQSLIVSQNAPAHILGRISDEDLPDFYAMSDIFSMPCRTRWMGLEQEGFGIVFMEAASCGIASLAGESGGASEAVVEGETGMVLKYPKDTKSIATALSDLMEDRQRLAQMGKNARKRAVADFSYDTLAVKLKKILKA